MCVVVAPFPFEISRSGGVLSGPTAFLSFTPRMAYSNSSVGGRYVVDSGAHAGQTMALLTLARAGQGLETLGVEYGMELSGSSLAGDEVPQQIAVNPSLLMFL